MTTTRLPRMGIIAVSAGLIILLVLAIWMSRSNGDDSSTRRGGSLPVKVATVEKSLFFDRIEALGTARAREAIQITAQVSERVSHIAFEDSALVKADDVLVELASGEEGAALQEARANLLAAQQEFNRSSELVRQGNAPGSRLENARAGRDVARAQLNAMQARYDDRIVRAPFDGIVGLRMVSPGELLQPGDLITTLDDVSLIKADFPVPERFLTSLAPGLNITVTTSAYPNETFEGKITAVDSRVNENTRAITVRAEILNEDTRIRPGMLLVVEIVTEKVERLAVPERAVISIGTSSHAMRLKKDNSVERVELETGRRRNGLIEILSGLNAQDVVITDGAHLLRSGQKVEITHDTTEDGEPVASRQPNKNTKTTTNSNRLE